MSTYPLVQDLGGLFLLDTQHMGNAATVGVYLVPGEGERFALVETGPGSTLATVERGVAEAGFDLVKLTDVLVTHIHLDHAGAAGALARETGAQVYAHDRGAPHLIDPSRLMASATRIYGDRMETLWGTMTPVPEGQLTPLSGGETFIVLGHQVTALYTPGHARHHLAYLLDGEAMFTGDAAAIRLPGSRVVRPALPPPELDLETWEATLETMRAAHPKRLLLTHFGEVTKVDAHLTRVAEQNRAWAEEILRGLQAGEPDADLVDRIRAFGNAELVAEGAPAEVVHRYRVTSNYEMTVTGVERYWRKFHPERIEVEV